MHFRVGRTAILYLLLVALFAPAAHAATPVFGIPTKVTPTLGFGYEPGIVIDRYGNIFATAHKENWQLAAAPDANSPTYARSMSWAWTSVDGGKSFVDIPGLTAASLEQHEFGDEGDMAFDDAGHLYFVDTNVTDVSFTRWSVTGAGLANMKLDFTRQLLPAAQEVDDRPWIIAHGNGEVFYFGNQGDKVTYPLGMGSGSGFGPGRYTVYASHDGGQTFDPFGYTLKDSGWCRPAADHAPGSHYVYAVCTNDGGSDDVASPVNANGTLWAYVSSNEGKSFERYKVGDYKALDSTTSWPTVVVGPGGDLWALYVDAGTLVETTDALGTSYDPSNNRLVLYHSADHGKTWTHQDITPLKQRGRYEYAWIALSPDGKSLGIGVYSRPDNNSPWRVYGGIWKPGQRVVLVSLDDDHPVSSADHFDAPADFMSSYFNPDGTLSVVWTKYELTDPTGSAALARDIYHARSIP
jgi:hypothetical protein